MSSDDLLFVVIEDIYITWSFSPFKKKKEKKKNETENESSTLKEQETVVYT